MGKKKKKNTNTDEQKPEEQEQEENNKNEGTDENTNESKSGNNKQNAGPIVLGVHLHCQGCVETVVKSLRGFDGVEEVEINRQDNRVTVKGKSADPVRVAERVRRKSGKHVEIISPVQKKQPEKKPTEKKPVAPKVIEVVLKMHFHCEKCAKDVRHCLFRMDGVRTVDIDMDKSLVTVKGTFDQNNLVTYICKRSGKHAEIVKQKNTKKNEKDDENQKEEGVKKEKEKEKEKVVKVTESPYPNYPPGLVYAPQLFSDENPNACSIL